MHSTPHCKRDEKTPKVAFFPLNFKHRSNHGVFGAPMMNMRRSLQIFLTVSIVSLFLLSSTVQSEVTYPEDSGIYISDEADVLNLTEKQQLNQISDDLEYETGTVMVLVTIESSTNYTSERDANMSLGDYAGNLFDEWKVGDQDYRDGILILIATNQSGNGYDWAYTGGDHWLEYWDVIEQWDQDLPDSFYSNLNDSNWSSALIPMLESLDEVVQNFWFENPGIEPFPSEPAPFTTPPTLDGASDAGGEASLADSIVGIVVCFGCLGLPIIGLVFLNRRGGGNVSVGGGGNNWGRQNRWGNNQHGYPQQGGYQENNHYYGNDFNNPQNQNQTQNLPPPSSGGESSRSSSSSRSGGSSRGGGSRSGGSSRGGSSGRGGGGRSGGSRRSGGGRRGR